MRGWRSRRLDEVCERVTVGHVGTTTSHYRDEGVLFLRTQNVGEHGLDLTDRKYIAADFHAQIRKSQVRAGDILMSRVVTHTVRCARAPDDLGPANCANVVLVRPGGELSGDFLLHYIRSPQAQRYLLSRKVGSAQLVVNTTVVQEWPVPFPSLPEQQRIVAILDEAFEGIATAKANAEKNLQNAREVFESHLAAVFSARNQGWTDRQLHSLCRRITVGHVGSMANLYKPAGIPFLRSQNIRPFSVSMQNMVFIDEDFHAALGKSSLQAGDVAIVRTGYPGTAAVIPDSLGVANCSDLVIVRPGPEIDAHFLCAFFNSAFGKTMVSGKVVGAAQKHFNVGAAKEVVLHLPPLVEQQAIVAAADELRDETDRLEGLCARKVVALVELKKSLLQQAFTGALTEKSTDKQIAEVA